MNRYDLEHITTDHPIMSREAWERTYHDAFRQYYSDEHVETVLRRAIRDGLRPEKVADVLTVFSGAMRIEGTHPLQVGIFRRKIRGERRPELPRESPFIFYPRRVVEVVWSTAAWVSLHWRYHRIKKRIMADPARMEYADEALRPVTEDSQPEFVRSYVDKIPHTHGAALVQAAAS